MRSLRTVIIGAGIHGLSTAWHLAHRRGTGEGIVVIDKTGPGAGATGVACGVVRNNYFQSPMGRLMVASVEVWESDPDAFGYHPVGYLAVAPESMATDLESVAARHTDLGYEHRLIRGEQDTTAYLRGIFPDWRAPGLTTVLHELRGGFAFADETIKGLVGKATDLGVEIQAGVTVTGLERTNSRVTTVRTNQGDVACDEVVVAVGPWIENLWYLLELPAEVALHHPDGTTSHRPMWSYQRLQEGTISFPPEEYLTADHQLPPVVHVDSDQPLHSDRDGRLLTTDMWGIYFKRDREGVQGGAVPVDLGPEAVVDPYGAESPHYTVDEDFIDLWTAGLAHCFGRFEGAYDRYVHRPSGAIGAFTPDAFPVFDWMADNCYVVADSNHGFKMLGVGREVAAELDGEPSEILAPFTFDRYATGALFPVSSSPYPWS